MRNIVWGDHVKRVLSILGKHKVNMSQEYGTTPPKAKPILYNIIKHIVSYSRKIRRQGRIAQNFSEGRTINNGLKLQRK